MRKEKIFKLVFFLFFLTFLIGYIIEKSGYYEYNLQNKTIMTNEAMARFEKDLMDGKDVKKEDYVVNTYIDYSTKLSRTTNNISYKLNVILKEGIEGFFKIIGTFVTD